MEWGLRNRISSIIKPQDRRALMLAVDHGYFLGPTEKLESPRKVIAPLLKYCDSLMLTRGVQRSSVSPTTDTPMVLRVSGGSSIIGDDLSQEDITVSVEDAIRLNASALAISIFVGSKYEYQTIVNLGRLVNEATKYGLPVLAVTAVGKDLGKDARYLSLACRIAAEQGAHIVKTYYCDNFEKVVQSCPVPIIVAGGKKIPERDALQLTYNAIKCGAVGVDMGRNIWQSEHPVSMIRAVRAIVHEDLNVGQAFELYKDLVSKESTKTANTLNQNRPNKVNRNKPKKTGSNKPAQNKPAQNKPAQNKPAQNKPAQNKPAQNKPAQNKPAQNKPAQNKPAQNKPAQTSSNKPVQTKSAESPSQKIDSKKPISDKPAQATSDKPAQATSDKPAQATSDKPAQATSDKPAQATSDKPPLLTNQHKPLLTNQHKPLLTNQHKPLLTNQHKPLLTNQHKPLLTNQHKPLLTNQHKPLLTNQHKPLLTNQHKPLLTNQHKPLLTNQHKPLLTNQHKPLLTNQHKPLLTNQHKPLLKNLIN